MEHRPKNDYSYTQHFKGLFLKNKTECVIYNGPTNALVCIKTLIQMSHTKTKTKLRGLSPRANSTDRAAAAGWRS
jgi:hypothetical protein